MASRKPETVFIVSVHNHLSRSVYALKNHNEYVGGIPDCWYSGNKADLWVEYKFLSRTPSRAIVHLTPDKPRTSGDLSILQEEWLENRYKEGRSVAVVVGCPEGGIILRDQEWTWEFTPQMFRDRLLPRKAIAQWIEGVTTR